MSQYGIIVYDYNEDIDERTKRVITGPELVSVEHANLLMAEMLYHDTHDFIDVVCIVDSVQEEEDLIRRHKEIAEKVKEDLENDPFPPKETASVNNVSDLDSEMIRSYEEPDYHGNEIGKQREEARRSIARLTAEHAWQEGPYGQ
jgi:hypothetical protein